MLTEREQELIRSVGTLTGEVRALRKSMVEMAARTVQSEENIEQSQRLITRSRWQIRVVALIAIAGLAVGGILFALRSESQQRAINRNAARLAQVVHTQCVIQDQTAARQAALLDSAIATERRRPRPDLRRIADLQRFKPDRINCGPKP